MKLGTFNAAGTAFVKCGRKSFSAMDTPRAIGTEAIKNGCKVGDKMTCVTHYPGFGKQTEKRVLKMDGNEGFAERIR